MIGKWVVSGRFGWKADTSPQVSGRIGIYTYVRPHY